MFGYFTWVYWQCKVSLIRRVDLCSDAILEFSVCIGYYKCSMGFVDRIVELCVGVIAASDLWIWFVIDFYAGLVFSFTMQVLFVVSF